MTSPPSRLPAGLRAFRHRDFRLFWSGQLVSLVGTWMQSVAQAWLVLELTGSPLRLGLVGAAQFTPMLVLSFLAGALADRLPKRRLILVSQTVLFAQALVLAVLVQLGHVAYWHVAVLALVYGVANTLDMPTRQAFLAVIRTEGRPTPRTGSRIVEEIVEGVRYAARTPRIALTLAMVLAVSLPVARSSTAA